MRQHKTWLSAKKIIGLLILCGVAAIIAYFFVLYSSIENSKIDNKEKLVEFIKKETEIYTISKMYHFQDDKGYDIIYGKDKADKSEYIVFNQTGNFNKDKLMVYKSEEFVSKETIEKEWLSACKGCTLKKSSPAMINDNPLWEMAYINNQDRYIMEYTSLKDGSTFEKLGLKLKYN